MGRTGLIALILSYIASGFTNVVEAQDGCVHNLPLPVIHHNRLVLGDQPFVLTPEVLQSLTGAELLVEADLLIPEYHGGLFVPGDLEVSGSVLIQPGTELTVDGDFRVTGSVMTFSNLDVRGQIEIAGDLDSSGQYVAGNGISVGNRLEIDGGLSCYGDLRAGVCKAQSCLIEGNVEGGLVIDELCEVTGSVTTEDIVVAQRLKVGGDLQVGYYVYTVMGDIEVGGNCSAFHITSAQDISVKGELSCRGSILAGAFPPTRLERDDDLARILCAKLMQGEVILGELIESLPVEPAT